MNKKMTRHFSIEYKVPTVRKSNAAKKRKAYAAAIAQMEETDDPDYTTYDNNLGLAEDMKFLASTPEMCDVTFLVGEEREPVCAVKAIMSARSKVFHNVFYELASPVRSLQEPMTRDKKLTMLLKRASEPTISLSASYSNPTPSRSANVRNMDPIFEAVCEDHQTVLIDEFAVDEFRQLIEYVHTGCVTLQPRTLLGLMNAADYYCVEELKTACAGFAEFCITVDTASALLFSAERYIQYKCTKGIVTRVLEFIDEHAAVILTLASFTLLPLHVVRLILSREELKADEYTKFEACLMWSRKFVEISTEPKPELNDVVAQFIEYIKFHKIPTNVLMKEVQPLGVLPYSVVMNALAYQADPSSLEAAKLLAAAHSELEQSMSVQSTGDIFGSTITLTSNGSSVIPISDSRAI